MSSSELFQPKEIVRQPFRPLGALSDLAVSGLAGRDPECLLALVLQAIPEIDLGKIEGYSADIACLDVKMLEAGITKLGGTPGQELSSLVDDLSAKTNQPSTITYEEIVILNPDNDPRIFTKGDVGLSENDFYRGHNLIEQILQSAIDSALADEPLNAAREVEKSVELVRVIGGQMPKEHFNAFRPFLTGVRGLPGPSGLYTARIPVLDILFAGDKFPQSYFEFLQKKLSYFPRQGREAMLQAINNGPSLVTKYESLGKPAKMAEELRELKESLLLFRGAHYGTVKSQVPEALSGEASGTGGVATPKQFLTDRIQMIQEVTV